MQVVRQLLVGLLVDAADGVAVGHFEEGEVLHPGVEAVLELVDGFLEVLVLEQEVVLDVELVFDPQLGLYDLGEEFGIAVLVYFIAGDGFAAEEVEQHLVDVELEGGGEVEAEEVVRTDCLHYPLDEVDPR